MQLLDQKQDSSTQDRSNSWLNTRSPYPGSEEVSMSPELHPALVHFPIALLVVGALLAWWELIRGSRNQTADFILIAAFAGAVAAAWSGEGALERLILTPEAAAAAANHERWGTLATWVAGASLAARGALLARFRARPVPRAWLACGAALWSVAAALALGAGFRGGKMVHQLGITPAIVPLRTAPEPEPFEGFQAAPEADAANPEGTGDR